MAWRRKKVNVISPEWSKENTEAYRWCINNGIKISPWAASSEQDNYYWWIDVEVNGAKKRSPFKYNGKFKMVFHLVTQKLYLILVLH